MIESHPWSPFIPPQARYLFLGSFPPPKKRFTMPFFYPNFQNDFWRVMGLIFFDSPDVFIIPNEKRFDQPKIESFLTQEHIAMYDVGKRIERLAGNASDNKLRIVEPVDLSALLLQIPTCEVIVATGQKALDEILRQANCDASPAIGESIPIQLGNRPLRLFRMPSTSRAYPKPLTYKADMYRRVFE